MHTYHSHSPLDSRKALDVECKNIAGPWCAIPFWHNLDTIPVPQSRPDRIEQAVATAFLLKKQLYVYERPVWRLFLKKKVKNLPIAKEILNMFEFRRNKKTLFPAAFR